MDNLTKAQRRQIASEEIRETLEAIKASGQGSPLHIHMAILMLGAVEAIIMSGVNGEGGDVIRNTLNILNREGID